MPEEKVKIDVVGTKYLCDKCGIGYMVAVDKKFEEDDQTWYPHKCDNCGHKADYTQTYPIINFNGL